MNHISKLIGSIRLQPYTKDNRKVSRKIFFIIGINGVGKTFMFHYFLENPDNKYIFYDFDAAKYRDQIFHSNNDKQIFENKVKLNKWWFNVGAQTIIVYNKIPVIFGQMLPPNKMLENRSNSFFKYKNIHFALLKCKQYERKSRLIARKAPKKFMNENIWPNDYLNSILNYVDIQIDTTNKNGNEIASEIINWLNSK